MNAFPSEAFVFLIILYYIVSYLLFYTLLIRFKACSKSKELKIVNISICVSWHYSYLVINWFIRRDTHTSSHWPEQNVADIVSVLQLMKEEKHASCIYGVGHSFGAASLLNTELHYPGTFKKVWSITLPTTSRNLY